MQQMLYARNGYPSDKEPSDYKEDDYKALLTDGIIKGAYILEKNIGNNKENTYVYDKKSDIVFKIPKTTIGGKAYHCYEVAQMQKGGNSSGDVEQEKNQIIDSESNLITVGDETYYAPNMKGFNAKNTSLIYYSDDFSEQVEINAKEYIDNKEKYKEEKEGKEIKELENISNDSFYSKYYKPVRENTIVKSKNSEYCVIRDIVFTIFIIGIVITILTIRWPSYFYKELIASMIAYIIGIIASKMKAKDFVSQIVIEKICKKEKKQR